MYGESLENKHHFMNIIKESDIHKREIERNFTPDQAGDYKKICAVRTAAFVELIKYGVQYIDLVDKYRIVIDDENYDVGKDALKKFLGEENYNILFQATVGNLVTAQEVGIVTHTNEKILEKNLLAMGYQNPFGPTKSLPKADPYNLSAFGAPKLPQNVNSPFGNLGMQCPDYSQIGNQQFEEMQNSVYDERLRQMENQLEESKRREREAVQAAQDAAREKESLSKDLERAEKREQHMKRLKEETDRALQETDELRMQMELENEKIRIENDRLSREKSLAENKVTVAHEALSRMEQERDDVEKRLKSAYSRTADVQKKLQEALKREKDAKEAREIAKSKEIETETRTSKLMEESATAKQKLERAIKNQAEADVAYKQLSEQYEKIRHENDVLRNGNNAVSAEKEELEMKLQGQITSAMKEKQKIQDSVDKIKKEKINTERQLAQALKDSMDAQEKLSEIDQRSKRLAEEREQMERENAEVRSNIQKLQKEKQKLLSEKEQTEQKLASAKEQLDKQTKEFKGSLDKIVSQKQQAEENLRKEQIQRKKAEENVKIISKKNEQLQAEKNKVDHMYEELLSEKERIKEKMEKALMDAADSAAHVREARAKVEEANKAKEAAIEARINSEKEREDAAVYATRMESEKILAEQNLKKAEHDREEARKLLKDAQNKERMANKSREEADRKLKEAEQERKSTLDRLTQLEQEQNATEQELENARAQKISAQQWAQKASQMAKKAQEERDAADAELRKAEALIRETETVANQRKWESEYAEINFDAAIKQQEESELKAVDAADKEQQAVAEKDSADEIRKQAEKANRDAIDEAARIRIEQGKVEAELKKAESTDAVSLRGNAENTFSGNNSNDDGEENNSGVFETFDSVESGNFADIKSETLNETDVDEETSLDSLVDWYRTGEDSFNKDLMNVDYPNGCFVAISILSTDNDMLSEQQIDSVASDIHNILSQFVFYKLPNGVLYGFAEEGAFAPTRAALANLNNSLTDKNITVIYGVSGGLTEGKQHKAVSKAVRFMNSIKKRMSAVAKESTSDNSISELNDQNVVGTEDDNKKEKRDEKYSNIDNANDNSHVSTTDSNNGELELFYKTTNDRSDDNSTGHDDKLNAAESKLDETAVSLTEEMKNSSNDEAENIDTASIAENTADQKFTGAEEDKASDTMQLNVTAPKISINIIQDGNITHQEIAEKSAGGVDLQAHENDKCEKTTSGIDRDLKFESSSENAFESREPSVVDNMEPENKNDEQDKNTSSTDVPQPSGLNINNDTKEVQTKTGLTKIPEEIQGMLPEEMLSNSESEIQIDFEEVPLLANENTEHTDNTAALFDQAGNRDEYERQEDGYQKNDYHKDGYHEDDYQDNIINITEFSDKNDSTNSPSEPSEKDGEDLYERIVDNEQDDEDDFDYEDMLGLGSKTGTQSIKLDESDVNDESSLPVRKEYRINKQDLRIYSTDMTITGFGVMESYDITVMSYERFGSANFIAWMNGYRGEEEELFLENYTMTGKSMRYNTDKYAINIAPNVDEQKRCNAEISVTGDVISAVSQAYVSGSKNSEGCIHIRENGSDIFIFPLSNPTPDFPMDNGAEFIAAVHYGMDEFIQTGNDGKLVIGDLEYRIFWDKDEFCCMKK